MTQFSKMIGGGGEFASAVKNSLQDFRHGSDYIIFHEVFGNIRREHHVIFSEKLANTLREVDWHGLADFKSIEVGNADNPKVENTFDNELMKFIVETMGKEWVNDYQTTNLTDIQEEIRRQKIEIMLKQAKIEAEKSGENSLSIDWSHLDNKLKWTGTGDISYNQIKSLIGSDDSIRKLEKRLEDFEKIEKRLENPDFNDPNIVHHYSETFEGGKKSVKEWDAKSMGSSGSTSSMKKHCSNCKSEKIFSTSKFCENCGQKLVVASQIQEITDQEAQQIERGQQRPFFPKPKGNW